MMLMLDLWLQAETSVVTHFGAYNRPPGGHFFICYTFHTHSWLSSETIQTFCYVGSFLCGFFLAWPDWSAPLTTSHAGLAPAFFLCTLPTLPAVTSITICQYQHEHKDKASTSDLVKYNSASDSRQLQLREHNHPLAIGGEFPSTFPAGIVSVAQTVILTNFQPSFQMSNFFAWADTFLIRFIWFCFRSHSMHCIIVCFHK